MAGLDEFKALLKGGGARNNLFRCLINFPSGTGGDTQLASFMIKAATLPSSQFQPIEVPFRGRKLKVAGDRTFEPWTITVINDTDMAIRNAFERWMNQVNSHTQNVSGFVGSNSLNYMKDMQVQQLDRNESVVKTYSFVNAFPTNISAIDLNFETNDAVEDFTVEINYQYWSSAGTTN